MPHPKEHAAIVEQWARDFEAYRERAEQAHRDVRLELIARLARVGVAPLILGADIDARRAQGWTINQIGAVLGALVMETHRGGTEHANLARAMFNAMAERDPCSLGELAERIVYFQ